MSMLHTHIVMILQLTSLLQVKALSLKITFTNMVMSRSKYISTSDLLVWQWLQITHLYVNVTYINIFLNNSAIIMVA